MPADRSFRRLSATLDIELVKRVDVFRRQHGLNMTQALDRILWNAFGQPPLSHELVQQEREKDSRKPGEMDCRPLTARELKLTGLPNGVEVARGLNDAIWFQWPYNENVEGVGFNKEPPIQDVEPDQIPGFDLDALEEAKSKLRRLWAGKIA
jgi:hypothetical protein